MQMSSLMLPLVIAVAVIHESWITESVMTDGSTGDG
jgi:hypothetical protein